MSALKTHHPDSLNFANIEWVRFNYCVYHASQEITVYDVIWRKGKYRELWR